MAGILTGRRGVTLHRPASGLPTPPVTGPQLWLRGDGITGVADGAAIPSWADYSGNGYTVAQTGAGKPTYSAAGGANGTPGALFAANSTQFFTTTAPTVASVTVFVVFKLTTLVGGTAGNSNQALVGSAIAGGFEYRTTGSGAEILKEDVASVGFDTAAQVAGTTYIRTATFASASAYATYRNGTQTKTGSTAVALVTASNFVHVGHNGQSGAESLDGLLSELLVYPRVLTSGELSTVDHYLATRYGLTVTD